MTELNYWRIRTQVRREWNVQTEEDFERERDLLIKHALFRMGRLP